MRFNQKIIKTSLIKYKDTKMGKMLDQEFKSTCKNDDNANMGTNKQMKNLRSQLRICFERPEAWMRKSAIAVKDERS